MASSSSRGAMRASAATVALYCWVLSFIVGICNPQRLYGLISENIIPVVGNGLLGAAGQLNGVARTKRRRRIWGNGTTFLSAHGIICTTVDDLWFWEAARIVVAPAPKRARR